MGGSDSDNKANLSSTGTELELSLATIEHLSLWTENSVKHRYAQYQYVEHQYVPSNGNKYVPINGYPYVPSNGYLS